MKILGIDYGRKKIGLAVADGQLAEPLKTIRYENFEDLAQKLAGFCRNLGIERVVVGISENEMAAETRNFGERLRTKLRLPLEYFDETLSSLEGQRLAIEAGIKKQKRRQLEDAFAASVMLQSYLESADV